MTTEANAREALLEAKREAIVTKLIAALDPRYELAYVDFRDSLDEKGIADLVRRDYDKLQERIDEGWWEQRAESTHDILQELLKDDILDEELMIFEADADSEMEVRIAIEDRDTSDILADLVRNSGETMLRIASPITEDDSLSYQEVDARHMLDLLGLPVTDKNLEAAGDVIANASTEFSVCMGYWLASVSVSDIYDLPYDCTKVRITDPGFWLGNPFAGSGWAGHFEGEIVVDRADLRTDDDAFGYGWMDVAGCGPGAFPAKIEEAK